ncbi:MAG TPA: VPDSG-CTERM sorting domain-containing protein [Verrucomicrobiae bacterium]|nr:VPDSG-CTERM sorting domain-containing protein [Verrucomicrobiae bacterium]
MNKKLLLLALVGTISSASADSYNQNVTAIFGSGNPNTGWTTDTGSGLTLALRGKNRHPATSTANVNGVYSFATGTIPPANNRAVWNWEFSASSGTAPLTAYDYYIGIDIDASQGVNYQYVNALTFWTDNEFGTAATANGAGLTPAQGALAPSNYTVFQNSQNIVFGPANGNPLIDGTYEYELFAVQAGAGLGGARLAEVDITVVVGAGGARVPDAGSTAMLLGTGLLGLAGLRRKL